MELGKELLRKQKSLKELKKALKISVMATHKIVDEEKKGLSQD